MQTNHRTKSTTVHLPTIVSCKGVEHTLGPLLMIMFKRSIQASIKRKLCQNFSSFRVIVHIPKFFGNVTNLTTSLPYFQSYFQQSKYRVVGSICPKKEILWYDVFHYTPSNNNTKAFLTGTGASKQRTTHTIFFRSRTEVYGT